VGLSGQFYSARDVRGVSTQKSSDQVFLLLDLFLDAGDGSGRSIYQLFGLAHIEQGSGAIVGQ